MLYRNEDRIKNKLYDIKGFNAGITDDWTYHINQLTKASLKQVIAALQELEKGLK